MTVITDAVLLQYVSIMPIRPEMLGTLGYKCEDTKGFDIPDRVMRVIEIRGGFFLPYAVPRSSVPGRILLLSWYSYRLYRSVRKREDGVGVHINVNDQIFTDTIIFYGSAHV